MFEDVHYSMGLATIKPRVLDLHQVAIPRHLYASTLLELALFLKQVTYRYWLSSESGSPLWAQSLQMHLTTAEDGRPRLNVTFVV